jgi:hypothetical protein
MPKAERARFGDAELALDRLLFQAVQASQGAGGERQLDNAASSLSELHAAIERAADGDPVEGFSRVRALVERHASTVAR